MADRISQRDADGISALLKIARAQGVVAGLEMASKFLTIAGNKKDAASMIRAAITTIKSE